MSKNKDESKFFVINFNRVELPKITENINRSIVEYGLKNDYPKLLVDMMNLSSTHSSIIKIKTLGVIGEGAKLKGVPTVEVQSLFNKWVNKPNSGEKLHSLLEKVSSDYQIYGAFAVEVIWSKNGKTITSVKHVDCFNIRIEPVNEYGEITHFQYSNDWSNPRKAINTPIRIAAFNPDNAKRDQKQLLYKKKYQSGSKYYGVPRYTAALTWIKIHADLAEMQNSALENGMQPSMHVAFKEGKVTKEEEARMYNDLKTKMSGTKNTGKFFVTWSDGSDTTPEMKPIETSTIDELYLAIDEKLQGNIITAHGVTSPLLVGIKTEGQLGGATEMDVAYQIFDKLTLKPDRMVLEEAFNTLLEYIIPSAELELVPLNPIEFRLSENILSKIMTINELRAKVNLAELSEEEATALQVKLNADNQYNGTQNLSNAA